jgi:hypothetical protein
MPVRHSRSFARGGSMRGFSAAAQRKRIWATSTASNVAVASGVDLPAVDLLAGLEAGGVGIIGGTVVRSHVWISAACTATDTNPGFLYGLLVSDKASAKPSAKTDFYVDWMMLREVGTATRNGPALFSTAYSYNEQQDIRAKRRIHEMNDTLWLLLSNVGSQSQNFSYFIRTLVLLP